MSTVTATHTVTGIEYADGESGPLLLDLHLPVSAPHSPVPPIIYLHGGAWITGARDETPERLAALAQAGAAVASIDYRFVQDAPYPAQFTDILNAAAWLTAHAEEYGYDPRYTTLAGASAGGHLASLSALLLTNEQVDTPALPEGFTVTSVVSMFASLDLTSAKPTVDRSRGLKPPAIVVNAPIPAVFDGKQPSPSARAALLSGRAESELDDTILAAYSPLHRLHPSAPPFLLLHGAADAIVPHAQSQNFVDAARELGVTAELELVEDANHEDDAFSSRVIAERIVGFIRRAGKRS